VLAAAREVGAEVPVTLRGSAGAGVLYAAIPASADPEAVATVVERLRRTCSQRGGSAVVLDAPTVVKETVDLWGPIPALDLMRRVKDEFDPDHRLSPGRFVGGI
jgi:glycolate oxidase FAD binding subunit